MFSSFSNITFLSVVFCPELSHGSFMFFFPVILTSLKAVSVVVTNLFLTRSPISQYLLPTSNFLLSVNPMRFHTDKVGRFFG